MDAPIRHPIAWQDADFCDRQSLDTELERVFDVCHTCRRCVSLCNAFPTLFDLIDESESMELDSVAKSDYNKVVEHCYLCDLCFMTKCPYVPPHEWNIDFPHLMLRAKAANFKSGQVKLRDKLLTATDRVGSLAGLPVVAPVVNSANKMSGPRKLLEKTLGVHAEADLPRYHSNTARKRLSNRVSNVTQAREAGGTRGRVALFVTCYGNRNAPQQVEDLVAVLEHNGIQTCLVSSEQCCGMPKLELGDLQAVERAKDVNIPVLAETVEQGWDLMALVPSCVLMFKQELPLMFPRDDAVAKVRDAMYDPFQYLMLRHKADSLNTDFKNSLGKVLHHAACHQRVQNFGPKTRELFQLIPDTTVESVERCSGHDGTYAVKVECHDASRKICRPIVRKLEESVPDHYMSDCPLAAEHIAAGSTAPDIGAAESPFTLLRQAYGI